jgi:hypothetical protein
VKLFVNSVPKKPILFVMYIIMQEPTRGPKQVIVKAMTVNKGTEIVLKI